MDLDGAIRPFTPSSKAPIVLTKLFFLPASTYAWDFQIFF